MAADRFHRLMEVFEHAVALSPSERASYLGRSVGDDQALRAEIEALLSHHERGEDGAGGVATAAGLRAAGEWIDEVDDARSPAMPVLRGDYRILRTIGEGGMGVVYEAEQTFPRRRVAIKSLRPGLSSARMLRRFRAEAEFLARLQHPGIAQIYEAGIADEQSPDQAYFVMELVPGETLTAYASSRSLDRRVRWEMLARICDAVQHAHQRGVIHRDLKPANIIVKTEAADSGDSAGTGVPKIVDFGIARAAVPEAGGSMATREGQLIGTPSYMSPEQLNGGDVDTRSDIYALGVIGYELMCGRLPFDLTQVSIVTAARVVAEEPAPPISSHDRSLRGDPEIIIATAMAKEPARRYASAAEMAQDIRRMLAGEAILARRDSAMYIVGRQIRRHRAVAAALALALLAVLAFAIHASINAERQRRLAVAMDRARAEAVAARDRADAATLEAEAARARAVEELMQGSIERGRMAGAMGNLTLAEDILWNEHFNRPGAPATHWALWRLYDQNPSEWVVEASPGARSATLSADGRTAAAVGRDGRIRLTSTNDGRPIGVLDQPLNATALCLWPDGSRLAAGIGAGTIVVISFDEDLPESITLRTPEPTRFGATTVHVSRDQGTLAAVLADGAICTWRTSDWSMLSSIPAIRGVTASALADDGSVLAVSSVVDDEPAVSLLDPRTGDPIAGAPQAAGAPVVAMRFSGDGRVLFVGDRAGTLTAWDRLAQRPAFRVNGLGGPVSHVVASADGRRLLALSRLKPYLIDAAAGSILGSLPSERFGALAVAWVDEHDFAVITQQGSLRRIDTRADGSARVVAEYPNWNFAVTYSRDGRLMGVGVGGASAIDVLDAASGRRVSRHTLPGYGTRTRGMRFSPDASALLTGSADGAVREVDTQTGEVRRVLATRRAEVYALDLNPAGTLCAVGYSDRRVILISLPDGSVTELPAFGKRIEGLAFSPDGRLLAISSHADGVSLWNVESGTVGSGGGGTEVRRLSVPSGPWGVAFSTDGARLFVSTQSGLLEAFDITTGDRLASQQGHQRLAPGLAVSPDGRLVATGGEEGLIKLWDAQTVRTLAEFEPRVSTVVYLAFSPDSRRLAAATELKVVLEIDLGFNDARVRAHEPYQRQRLRR